MRGMLDLDTAPDVRFDSGRFLSTFRHRLVDLGAQPRPVPHGFSFTGWAALGPQLPFWLDGEIQVPDQTHPRVHYAISSSRSFLLVLVGLGVFVGTGLGFTGRADPLQCTLLAALTIVLAHAAATGLAILWLRATARRVAIATTTRDAAV